jgi:hypothetical protein
VEVVGPLLSRLKVLVEGFPGWVETVLVSMVQQSVRFPSKISTAEALNYRSKFLLFVVWLI